MPIALDLASLLAVFAAFLVCYALLVAYKSTLGALLQVLASALNHSYPIVGDIFGFLANGITALDSEINAALSSAVLATQHAWQRILSFTATLIHEAVKGVDDLASATYSAIHHTVTHVLPDLVGAATLPLTKAIHSLSHELTYVWKVLTSVAHTAAHASDVVLPRIAIKVVKPVKVEIEKAAKPLAVAVAGTIPLIGPLEREVSGLAKWIKTHTKDLTIAGLAGALIGGVLAKVGMTWLRCSNVNRAGRSLCGMNPSVLEGLLAGLVSIFGTLGIVAFAEDVQDVISDFSGEVTHFWRADVAGPGGDRALGSATLN